MASGEGTYGLGQSPHSTYGETDAQGGEGTCPRSHLHLRAEPGREWKSQPSTPSSVLLPIPLLIELLPS